MGDLKNNVKKGPKMSRKVTQRGSQNGSQNQLKMCKNRGPKKSHEICHFWTPFGCHFGTILGPFWGILGGLSYPIGVYAGLWAHLFSSLVHFALSRGWNLLSRWGASEAIAERVCSHKGSCICSAVLGTLLWLVGGTCSDRVRERSDSGASLF